MREEEEREEPGGGVALPIVEEEGRGMQWSWYC